jgi:indolepyruvate ferredoxin oxidoreductase alpha subunit
MGDSTFLHSGITSLMDMAYSNTPATAIILDNRITAMTGRQDNPGSGHTLAGIEAIPVNLEAICRAVGIRHVQIVDPYDLARTQQVIDEEMRRPEPSVVIARRSCMLDRHGRGVRSTPLFVKADACTACKACVRIGCPAIEWQAGEEGGKGCAHVNQALCVGCGLCRQVCKFDAFGVGHES